MPTEESRPNRPAYGETYVVEARLVLPEPELKVVQLLILPQPLHRKRLRIGFGVGSLVVIGLEVGIEFAMIKRTTSRLRLQIRTQAPSLPPASHSDLL